MTFYVFVNIFSTSHFLFNLLFLTLQDVADKYEKAAEFIAEMEHKFLDIESERTKLAAKVEVNAFLYNFDGLRTHTKSRTMGYSVAFDDCISFWLLSMMFT